MALPLASAVGGPMAILRDDHTGDVFMQRVDWWRCCSASRWMQLRLQAPVVAGGSPLTTCAAEEFQSMAVLRNDRVAVRGGIMSDAAVPKPRCARVRSGPATMGRPSSQQMSPIDAWAVPLVCWFSLTKTTVEPQRASRLVRSRLLIPSLRWRSASCRSATGRRSAGPARCARQGARLR